MNGQDKIQLRPGDALIIVDVQNDFLPGGALAVPHGDEVIPKLNQYVALFESRGLPVVATRDWHPEKHCSFKAQGGIWPAHCVVGTPGAQFSARLKLSPTAAVISKADTCDQESYSGFANTDLAQQLRDRKVKRTFIGGLATDYCVLNTVLDAVKNGFEVFVLRDASRAVNVRADDGAKAEAEMARNGAVPIEVERIAL